jgi:PTH1 family peptidyl-tRNA hydrolase
LEKKIYLMIGLGNPGEKYAHTRHNAGFEVAERIERKLGVRLRKKMLQPWAEAEWTDGEKKIVLCKPLTFMNNSGEAVKKLMDRYRVPAEQMIVIYDDIDLPPGKIRVRSGGGPGTHNGMRSIVGEIGTESFPRIRVGTGDRPKGEDLVKWVLGRYGAEEQEKMDAAFDTAAECAMEWAEKGIDAAMRLCAGRKD